MNTMSHDCAGLLLDFDLGTELIRQPNDHLPAETLCTHRRIVRGYANAAIAYARLDGCVKH